MSQTSSHPIIVFCHLRWHFVTQRPQHIVNRLAKQHDIFFVEESVGDTQLADATLKITNVGQGITLLQADCERVHFTEFVSEKINQLLTEYDQSPILWFYSGSFAPFIENLDVETAAIVYDCMDELSAFKGADPQLIKLEKQLLKKADVVFTGGKSLYEAKNKVHDNVYCYPSSVDRSHFEQALKPQTKLPSDILAAPQPRIGFYGVLDERLDLKLVAETADLMPQASFVYIGPVVKIDSTDLPQRPNIFYLGGKDYQELPAYLKGFDIAFMPFALNQSTHFISPTKTLEFMAARKPIVSTPIYDVKRDYAHEVTIISTADQAVAAFQKYLQETSQQKQRRIQLQIRVIDRTSWDTTVTQMEKNLQQVIAERNPWHFRQTLSSLAPGFQEPLSLNVTLP